MRWKNTLALAGLCLGVLSIVASSLWLARRDRMRDAWALFSQYEPACEQPISEGPDSSAAAAAARRALGRETLAIVDELTGRGRSRTHELLAAGVAASRQACGSGIGVSDVASTRRFDLADLETHRRHAAALGDLQFAKERLGRLVPMTDEERGLRADRYGERLSDAVSREMAMWVSPKLSLPILAEVGPETPSIAAADSPARLPLASPKTPRDSQEAEPGRPDRSEPPRIVIRSSSGESWVGIRNRRATERALRARAWKPLADRELAQVMRLRRALGRHLETDSLDGGADICVRLGDAARETDRAVVRAAPDRRVSLALSRALQGYAAAGRACSRSRYAMAFVALTDADASWLRVIGVSRSSDRSFGSVATQLLRAPIK